eukprot:TRINITY_DN5550_c0_g1_i1.p2 TRINITY_DN5550_c0_g1~~TRINITY_DN5550_c0_g1_i1.p2  ORF type:complete len:141 (+),score=80.59 TRINITY_DN5550_c0_g1_i1:284-706(+)
MDILEGVNEYRNLPASLQDAGKLLADLMAKLAECARKGDAQGIIATTRQIADVVKTIKAECKSLAANCRDPKLKDSITSASNAMGNWSMQLKILGGVKAASVGTKDATAESNLVSCCEGISKNVRSAMFGCETAKRAKLI